MSTAGGSLQSLTREADALKASGRRDEALAVYARAAALHPASGVAEHNLAATLGDAARYAEAERHARRALAKGLDAPETWLVLGRALQGQRRLDEAEAAYQEAIRRRPSMADAHRDLAQLVWMRSADVAAATARLDMAIAADPLNPVLRLVRVKALDYGGDTEGAYETLLQALRNGEDFVLHAAAADLAARLGRPQAAMRHAERAAALGPDEPLAQVAFAEAALASGAPERAAVAMEALLRRAPDDQHALALLATAWRLLGDARYHELYDYERLVLAHRLRVPAGWPDLEAYLGDLAVAVDEAHAYHTHPFDQSLRGGSQAPNILTGDHPAIRAFPDAVGPAIEDHLRALGQGDDPLRRRNTGRWTFQGAWSVRLRPNGFHADHVHSRGWLSSACYVALPSAVEDPGRQGWLKFGQPGVPTDPPLAPEWFVKPEPGLLALFPSYMWHGTVPFAGEAARLTIAFDLLPN